MAAIHNYTATSLSRPVIPANSPWEVKSQWSSHPLAAELDISCRLSWVEQVAQRYQLKGEDETTFLADTKSRIERRLNESRLFLGVIGEFSSGKSTLINALARDRLLRSDVLQGTTAAVTLIHHGDELRIEVVRQKKNLLIRGGNAIVTAVSAVRRLFSQPRPEPAREELLEVIHRCTADEEFARDVIQVNVQVPSKSLIDGVVIVDTPGANATNLRHAIVTGEAIRDLCDATLVVIPAEAAGADSLFEFLKAHAGDSLHRCVFLVTKLDLVRRERDRQRVLDHLQKRISRTLGVATPKVLSAAPRFVVDSLQDATVNGPIGESSGDDASEVAKWISQFEAMEVELRQTLREKRLQVIADDLANLLTSLYEHLHAIITGMRDKYRKRHEALERLVIPNVDRFIQEKVQAHTQSVRREIASITRNTPNNLEAFGQQLRHDITVAIHESSTHADLKRVFESKIDQLIGANQEEVIKHLGQVTDAINTAAESEIRIFHEEFQRYYRSLANLDEGFGGRQSSLRPVDCSAGPSQAELTNVTDQLTQNLKQVCSVHFRNQLGGAMLGAFIGSFLFPGVGTVIGSTIGLLCGMASAPPIEDLKNECLGKLDVPLRASFETLVREANTGIEQISLIAVERVDATITQYGPRYTDLIAEMRARDEASKRKLKEQEKQIENDLDRIRHQQEEFEAVRKKIREL